MPNYDYQCLAPACQHKQITMRPYESRETAAPRCEKCGERTEYRIAAPGIKSWAGCHNDEYTKTGPRK